MNFQPDPCYCNNCIGVTPRPPADPWHVWYRRTSRHSWRDAGITLTEKAARDWAAGLNADRGWQTFYGIFPPTGRRVADR